MTLLIISQITAEVLNLSHIDYAKYVLEPAANDKVLWLLAYDETARQRSQICNLTIPVSKSILTTL